MDRVTDNLATQVESAIAAGVTDSAVASLKKKVDDILYTIEDDIMYRLKDALAPNLTGFVRDMAERTVNAILEGNEGEMIRYLSCDQRYWTGRGRDHPVIHGTLFEQGCIKLRRDIVNAHRDLLVNERIKDLEDQVRSLVEQVNKANAEKERMWERVRDLSPV